MDNTQTLVLNKTKARETSLFNSVYSDGSKDDVAQKMMYSDLRMYQDQRFFTKLVSESFSSSIRPTSSKDQLSSFAGSRDRPGWSNHDDGGSPGGMSSKYISNRTYSDNSNNLTEYDARDSVLRDRQRMET